MPDSTRLRTGIGRIVMPALAAAALVSCGVAPSPFPVVGRPTIDNAPPTLDILEPTANFTISQGEPFIIRFIASDADDNAQVSFELVNTATNARVVLLAGMDEDASIGTDSVVINATFLVPVGTYHLLGVIDDGANPPDEQFAVVAGEATPRRVVITVVGPGEGPQTVPPKVAVTQPAFNLSVSQDDVLTITVQPTRLPPDEARPFDPDSVVELFVLLDFDNNPDNDDPRDPDPSQIIVLRTRTIQPGEFEAISFDITVDLETIPRRPDGEPFFIRASVFDGTNPPVHSFAAGTISVVRLAAGTVDLFDIGRTLSGARFQGFNPAAHLGSSISTVSDFDADGVDDFIMVAQFGNPQNVGPVGEAYLVYGMGRATQDTAFPQPGSRFGGTISVNTITDAISGVIFQAPPVRDGFLGIPDPNARTLGITDVSFVPDLTADGRPELLFGLGHVHGALDSIDHDPGDDAPDEINPFGCYPDFLVNNFSDPGDGARADTYLYAGGMGVMVNSTNRNNDGLVNPNRLEFTQVSLEHVGQRDVPMDGSGFNVTGNITGRADNDSANFLGNDVQTPDRIAGSRFISGGFDFIDAFGLGQGPREGLYGQTFRALSDLRLNGLPELIVSAPRNERHLFDLESTFGFFGTQVRSTLFPASITVFPGTNYNQTFWRDKGDDVLGTATQPPIDQQQFPRFGSCSPTNPAPRGYVLPAETFGIFAEDIDDFLGDGQSAGDVNLDGIGDILAAAPRNDRTPALVNSGAVYIIYGRPVFGEVRLEFADDPVRRPPMLRIRGNRRGDQIGWTQSAVLDVNGDGIDDILIGSPHTDFGPVSRTACAGDFTGDDLVDENDLREIDFDGCMELFNDPFFGPQLFSDDPCKAFDYTGDGVIDADDRCVFCCLSAECTPDESCVFGRGADCCDDLVNNGFVAVIFGGIDVDGDRNLSQIATSQLPGVVFFGSGALHRAGHSVSSAGDFNRDGFGDLLIAAPGETRIGSAGRERLGVVYLVFGGPHLENRVFNLIQVGTSELPGIAFFSPYVKGRPNEAAPTTVALIGDINADGFDDITIGNPKADFIDSRFPQGPDAPSTDAAVGRRRDTGDAYVIYGNNFGPNRAVSVPP